MNPPTSIRRETGTIITNEHRRETPLEIHSKKKIGTDPHIDGVLDFRVFLVKFTEIIGRKENDMAFLGILEKITKKFLIKAYLQ